MPALPTCKNEFILMEDAEDILRDARAIVDELVLQAPAGTDLTAVSQWNRRAAHYFGEPHLTGQTS